MLWHASKINEALSLEDPRTPAAYANVREALIKVVRSIHVEYGQVVDRLSLVANFMRQFETVASLNYDVLVYWAILCGNKRSGTHMFKDCFVDDGHFRQSWKELRDPMPPKTDTTIVGYPHGNLALAVDVMGNERKLVANDGASLLETIFNYWNSGSYSPVFVSEGTSTQKLASIRRSPYLTTMHNELLTEMSSVVIFGWSIGEHDLHLLDAICHGGAIHYAYAVDPKSSSLNQEMERVKDLIRQRQAKAQVRFFDRTSPGCWLNAP